MSKPIAHRERFTIPDFPLTVVPIQVQIPFELHTHEFTELVIITAGAGLHVTQVGAYPVQPGDTYVIKPGFAHGYRNTVGLSLVNVLFYPDQLGLPLARLASLPGYQSLFHLEPQLRDAHAFKSRLFLPPEQRRQVVSWVSEMDDELRSANPGREFMALAWLMRIVTFLSRAFEDNDRPETDLMLRVARVITHMEQNLQQPLQISDLTRIAAMSERGLQRAFQDCWQTSPMTYFNKLRVSRAQELLKDRNKRIGDVAFETGFTDSNYFSRTFRLHSGMSPTAFRARLKDKRPAT